MTEGNSKPWLVLAGLGVAALLAGAALFLIAPGTPSHGPVPVLWDKEACAHCRMHVGEPAFAAQLQTRDGSTQNFDDPGCLFEYLASRRVDVAAIYFHDSSADRWLTPEEVGFVKKTPTPMGFGLAAVARTTPGAISFDEAKSQITNARKEARGGER